ncbi:laccase [Cordyceps militaris]|uniref:Laccase n=1 Tax=Cordyceps militaris TaxID=73501 RepID=A0A2H4SLS8_CORMI|nr:laccase [Cordyceps militaris]
MLKKASWLLLASLAIVQGAALNASAPACVPAAPAKNFTLEITWERYAPLGIARKMLLVNGQTPGPELQFNQDDAVAVHVVNKSPFKTSVHFHGLEMKDTPWSDGVPGLTQRLVPPGGAFVHRFTATQHGSYWYHAHARDQIEDGLYGPLFIHARPTADRPFHLISADAADVRAMVAAEKASRALTVFDLMHITSEEKWQVTLASGIEITCYDRILFNGKGRVQCFAPADMQANLTPIQKDDLAFVPGSALTDRGCLPPKVMAAFGGDVTRLNESAIPHDIFHGCAATADPVETIAVAQHDWVSLNIVGSTNFATGALSIDEHDMWVYAVDGSYITPERVQAIPLSNGERYSVLVRPARAGDFKIRFNAISAPQMINGYAVLSVRGGGGADPPRPLAQSAPWVSIAGTPLSAAVVWYSDARARPYPAEPVPASADALHVLNMRLAGTSYKWALNSTQLEPDRIEPREPPLLFGSPERHARDNVTLATRNGTWVDLVLLASMFPMPPHPVHKHGNKMYRIGAGNGPFKWASVDEAVKEVPGQFNLVNPPRRDTFTTMVARKDQSWIVVRYHVASPGAWLLHCHISNHMMGGMVMVLLDGVDAWPKVPDEYLNYR